MNSKLLRIFFALLVACVSFSNAHAFNVSLDSDTYTYDEITNQIIVRVSYDFIGVPMFGGGMDLIYDSNALTFVSYTLDISNSEAEEEASPTGSLVEPGLYYGFGIGNFDFMVGISDAATFGTFVFDVNQEFCDVCFILEPNSNNPMVSLMGEDLTMELFGNGITQATVIFPETTDTYQYADECVYLRDDVTDQFVRFSNFRYETSELVEEATPFYMKATALGNYILFSPDAKMMSSSQQNGIVVPSRAANNRAEWTVSPTFEGNPFRITNNFSDLVLTVGSDGRLIQLDTQERRWRIDPATGCTGFPEVGLNVLGDPLPSSDVEVPVSGFIDAHSHLSAFEFIGGRLHCGKPWDRYGVTEALQDCPDHFASGEYAVMENLLSNGTRDGFHLNKGWPIFDPPESQGWPRYDSLTHEGMYWKGIERAWKSGLRLMVANLTENKPLCELYWLGDNSCDDRLSIANQAAEIRKLETYIDGQYKGPGNGFFRIVESPSEAREVISEGKLAVVLGVETTRPMSCVLQPDFTDQCTATESLDDTLTELWNLGVRSMFPIYTIDNIYGGTSMASDFQGLLYNYANQAETGNYWKVEACTGDEEDNTPPSPGIASRVFYGDANLEALTEKITESSKTPEPPIYPPGPVCNTRGLTPHGEFLINSMADMGMIIETDHMSAKTRDQVLTILEQREYSGVATSHGEGGSSSRERIQALGGFVAPHASDTVEFINAWQEASSTQSSEFLWGIGYGADTNGLRKQAAPREDANINNPVTYPFDNFDGTTSIGQNIWGLRTWDINQDGVAHYGMYPDWIKDLENVAGPSIIEDLANGAEAYIQMWERVYPVSPVN